MASPQRENGHIRIANELYDEIFRRDFPKRQLNILMFIMRFSYGCGRKSTSPLKLVDFEAYGVSAKKINAELDLLVNSQVIFWNKDTNIFSLNKDYEQWFKSLVPNYNNERFKELIKKQLSTPPKRGDCKTDNPPKRGDDTPETGGGIPPKRGDCKTDNPPKRGDDTPETGGSIPPKRGVVRAETLDGEPPNDPPKNILKTSKYIYSLSNKKFIELENDNFDPEKDIVLEEKDLLSIKSYYTTILKTEAFLNTVMEQYYPKQIGLFRDSLSHCREITKFMMYENSGLYRKTAPRVATEQKPKVKTAAQERQEALDRELIELMGRKKCSNSQMK